MRSHVFNASHTKFGMWYPCVVQYVPKISQFYACRKPSWKCPLSADVRTKIKNKHMLWKQYLVTRNVEFLRKYKRLRNQIRKITTIHKAEQNEVARSSKSNTRKFWAYIKNKTSLKTTIGDVKTRVDDKEIILSNDEAFCSYFPSIFTIDDGTTNNVDDQENEILILNETNLEIYLSDVEFNNFSIFKALDKLNIYKSPGPDGLHPRILFETRNVISILLRIIFEASMRMKQLTKDWVNANICAVHKKETSQICQTIDP